MKKCKSKFNLRPCAVQGSQVFWKGYFHRLVEINNRPFALVETLGGSLEKVGLDLYWIRFTDREDDVVQVK